MHLMLYRSAFTLATEYARNPAQHNSVLKVRWNLPWSDRSVEGPVAISEEYVLHMRELSAVQTMATAVQTGSPDLVFVALGRIARWIEANGYSLAGPYRELGLELFKKSASDEMLIEIRKSVESMSPSTDTLLTTGT